MRLTIELRRGGKFRSFTGEEDQFMGFLKEHDAVILMHPTFDVFDSATVGFTYIDDDNWMFLHLGGVERRDDTTGTWTTTMAKSGVASQFFGSDMDMILWGLSDSGFAGEVLNEDNRKHESNTVGLYWIDDDNWMFTAYALDGALDAR